jgi:broad specificity phosphatase PhoE
LLNELGEHYSVFQNRAEGFIQKVIMDELINLDGEICKKEVLLVTHGEYLNVIDILFNSSSSIKSPKNCSIYQILFTYDKTNMECNNYFKIPGLSYSWKIHNDNSHLND